MNSDLPYDSMSEIIAEQRWQPTCHLRLAVNPTPGMRDELQQMWSRPCQYGGSEPEEQWRPVPRVEV